MNNLILNTRQEIMNYPIGENPRIREVLGEIQNLIRVAERVPWNQQEARSIIETLRLGIPPPKAALGLTVGREKLFGRLSLDLNNVRFGKSHLIFLIGEYGIGKTHTLRVLQEYSHQQSFASSLVELNQRECPLHNLGLVYQKIVRNLQTKQHSAGFALPSLLDGWADYIRNIGERDRNLALGNLRKLDHDFHCALTTYFECKRVGKTKHCDLVLDWMTGAKLSSNELTKIGVSSNISQLNALSMLGNLVSMLQCIGLHGVVILLDEVDRTLAFENVTEIEASRRNLNMLIRSSLNFPYLYFIYSSPPSFLQNQQLLTGVDIKPQNVVNLQPLSSSNLVDLACKIRDLHLLAYSWDNQSRVCDSTLKAFTTNLIKNPQMRSSVRSYVRTLVEALDCCQMDANLTLKKLFINPRSME